MIFGLHGPPLPGPHFDVILVLLPTYWQFVFTRFVDTLIWVPFCMLFGLPGNLENGARTLTGVRFSHFGPPFFRPDF